MRLLSGLIAGHVAPGPAEGADGVGEAPSQHAPEPGCHLRLRAAAKLGQLPVRLQQCLLDDVGRVELATKAAPELRPSQQQQIVPEAPHRLPGVELKAHRSPSTHIADISVSPGRSKRNASQPYRRQPVPCRMSPRV